MPADRTPTWVCPIPKDRPAPPTNDPLLGKPTCYVYRTIEGEPAWIILRWDTPTGKVIRPLSLWMNPDGSLVWHRRMPPGPRTLYNLHKLAERPDAPVLVVEGEKKAEAASLLFPDWVTTTSGSSTSAPNADCSSLAGRKVAIWGDADNPGRLYALAFKERAEAAGAASVGIVALPDGLPNKWDLADMESNPIPGLDPEMARSLMEAVLHRRPQQDQGFARFEIPDGPWIIGNMRRMLTEPPPPVRWLVEGLIPAGVPGILAARAGAGKSMTALLAAMGLASGLRVLGRSVSSETARGVLYVGLEDDQDEFHRRLARGIEILKEDPCWTPDNEELLHQRFCTIFPNRVSGQSHFLEDQWEVLAEIAGEIPGGCGLTILDTLARMADGDENKASDIRRFNESVSALAQKSAAAVLSIHHVGKGNDGNSDKKLFQRLHPETLRGSSSMEAAARFIIQMAALSPSEAQVAGLDVDRALRGAYVALQLSKSNSFEKGDTVLLERRQASEPGAGFLCPHPDSERILALLQGATAVLKLNKRDQVLLAIAEAGGSLLKMNKPTAAALIWPDALDPRNQWDKALTTLRQEGWLTDLTMTDAGWAKAETIGLPAGRKTLEASEDPSFYSVSLEGQRGRKECHPEVLPPGRIMTEGPEVESSFHTAIMGDQNGRKDNQQEVVL